MKSLEERVEPYPVYNIVKVNELHFRTTVVSEVSSCTSCLDFKMSDLHVLELSHRRRGLEDFGTDEQPISQKLEVVKCKRGPVSPNLTLY